MTSKPDMGCPRIFSGQKGPMCHFFLADGVSVAWTRAGSNETLILDFFFSSYYPLSIQWVHGAILDARDLSKILVLP